MIRKLTFSLVALVAALAGGCGGGDDAEETTSTPNAGSGPAAEAEPQGPVFRGERMGRSVTEALVQKSLSEGGLQGLVITAPESATVQAARFGGGTQVRASRVNYSVSIREAEFNPDSTRQAWEIVSRGGTYVVEQDDLLIYQRPRGGFQFTMGLNVGGTSYTCGSNTTIFPFTRPVVDQMVESCRTLAPATGG